MKGIASLTNSKSASPTPLYYPLLFSADKCTATFPFPSALSLICCRPAFSEESPFSPNSRAVFSPIYSDILYRYCAYRAKKEMILLCIAWDFDIFWTLDKRRQYGATFNITSIWDDMVHNMVRHVPICKTCETSADMQDMRRYTRIWTTFCRSCWRTLIWKSWQKMVSNIARYARYVAICHNMLPNGEPQSSVICSNSPVWYVETVHWYESI